MGISRRMKFVLGNLVFRFEPVSRTAWPNMIPIVSPFIVFWSRARWTLCCGFRVLIRNACHLKLICRRSCWVDLACNFARRLPFISTSPRQEFITQDISFVAIALSPCGYASSPIHHCPQSARFCSALELHCEWAHQTHRGRCL